MYEWTIRPADNNSPWVATLESQLPHPYPSLYRLLTSRFGFAEFEVGPLIFLANTGRGDLFHELFHIGNASTETL